MLRITQRTAAARLAGPRTPRLSTHATSMTSSAQAPVLAAGSAEPPAGPDRSHPTFITTWSCPYAMRTAIALNAKGLQYTPVFVDLQNKPEWFFKHNPYGRVPTLVWQEPGGKVASLYESLVCNEYIADLPGGRSLLPDDAAQRAQARLAIDQFGAKVGPAFGKAMFAEDASSGPAADELTAALQWLEGELNKHEGPLFMGKDLTLADAAVAPFLLRLQLLEGLSGYKAPALPRLHAYIAALEGHPAVKASMQPPDSSKSYQQQLLETYQEYVAKRRAAAST